MKIKEVLKGILVVFVLNIILDSISGESISLLGALLLSILIVGFSLLLYYVVGVLGGRPKKYERED